MSPIHSRLKVLSSYKENGVRMAYTDTHVNLYVTHLEESLPLSVNLNNLGVLFLLFYLWGYYQDLLYRILGTSSSHLPFALGLARVARSKWPALRQ